MLVACRCRVGHWDEVVRFPASVSGIRSLDVILQGSAVREIPASLPAIGAFRVHLHRESDRIVDFFGEEELRRLGRVNHLGVATTAFPGINHTRLEYVLLQCAIIQLVSKLYKDNRDLALANRVELAGLANPVSSGEELLKSWALLANVGHPNWTFGTERALLEAAMGEEALQRWLVSGAVEEDLNRWANEVIADHRVQSFRFLLTLLRIRTIRPHDTRKHTFRQLVRNLVLPEPSLSLPSQAAREKLSRLRHLFDQVRLLSMVTLDAYHSHSPLRLQLLPAIQELAESSGRTAGFEKFSSVLRATAGWLADEVYMHPSAVATQRDYEMSGARDAIRRFRKAAEDRGKKSQFLKSVMADGFGQPHHARHLPLIRLSFERFTDRLLGGGHRHARVTRLNEAIAVPPATIVSLDHNGFVGATHLDLLYRPKACTHKEAGKAFARLCGWLLKATEAEALDTFRRMTPVPHRDPKTSEDFRRRLVRSRLLRGEHHLLEVLFAVVSYLTPVGWTVNFEDFARRSSSAPIGFRVVDSKQVRYDLLAKRLADSKTESTRTNDMARVHELASLERFVKRRWSKLVVAALHPIVLRDHFGKKKDEWDGAVLTVDDDRVRLFVIEAKGTSSKAQRTTEAWDQLLVTRTMLKSRYPVPSRRTRLDGFGAVLSVELWRDDV